jgi:hypothetical protein
MHQRRAAAQDVHWSQTGDGMNDTNNRVNEIGEPFAFRAAALF